jgi:hypothetical protein
MRLNELFTPVKESLFYRGPIKYRYGSESDTDIIILKNPSKGEFLRLRDKSQWKDVRGMLDNDLYIWDAAVAIHSDISRNFKIDGDDLHLKVDGVEVNDLPPTFTDEDAEEYAAYLRANTHLIRLYGTDFRIVLEAPDEDKLWQF